MMLGGAPVSSRLHVSQFVCMQAYWKGIIITIWLDVFNMLFLLNTLFPS